MRLLGVDYGTARIGLALSDPTGAVATPLAVIESTGDTGADAAAVARIASREKADKIVLGLPRRMSGESGPEAREAAEFARLLREASGLPVVLWDERLTTALAERVLVAADVRRAERRARVDKVAAALILQSYMDAHHGPKEHREPPDS
ncbi:MAG: Holliday junction resolvase RuvX [Armatimonadetes bacterium]|nr:Holliday junction resolvase RuvX [Armatimonadota bacterium]